MALVQLSLWFEAFEMRDGLLLEKERSRRWQRERLTARSHTAASDKGIVP